MLLTPFYTRVRRFFCLILLLSILLLGLSMEVAFSTQLAKAASTTYYVNCSASSNGSGTQSSPWNTLTTVDNTTFQPGDIILFARGTTCNGLLHPLGSGSSSAAITVNAYGTGALPIIAGGTNTQAVLLSDQQYWTIENLTITGGVTYGVFVTGNTANTTLYGISLINLDVSGASGTSTSRGDSGEVYIYPHVSSEVFNGILINGVTTHDSKVSEGIFVGAAAGAFAPVNGTFTPGNNVMIENSTAYNVAGDGILLTEVQNGTIQHSVVYDSGTCAVSGGCGSTPSGLWEWYCQTCTLQYNESYDNHTWGSSDGGGFDIDTFNQNNILQYNYGHDNDGYCAMDYVYSGVNVQNTFRYNVCANNLRNASTASYGDLLIQGATNGVQIYNNTFYHNPISSSSVVLNNNGSYQGSNPDLFENNLIYSATSNLLSSSSSGLTIDHNLYWTTTGSTSWTYNGTTYTSLSAYQTGSGQDTHSLNANPQLNNPTYHAAGISTYADTLAAGSPATRAGTNVCNGITGCSMGTQDFFGNPITTNGPHNIGAFDSAVSNPGFESGNCTGYSSCYSGASVVNSHAHSGTYAIQLPAGSGAEQIVTGLSSNTSYVLTGWAEAGTAGQCTNVGVKNYDSSGNQQLQCINSTTYTEGMVTFTTGASSTSATIYLWQAGSGTGWGDDLALRADPVINGGFESGNCTGYSSCYSGASVVNSHAHSGTYAIQLPAGSGAEQIVTGLTPNTTYTLIGWAEAGTSGQCTDIGVKNYDSSGNQQLQCISSTSYQQATVSFTTGASSTSATVFAWQAGSGTGWGDDLAVI